MSDERLKPCPFCGGEAFLHVVEPHKHKLATWMPDYGGGAFVECTQCTSGMSAESEAEVIEAWNTRKPMERIVERLEKEFDYNSEQAEIWRSGEDVDIYMIRRSNDYLGRANCYGKAIRIVKGGGVDETD